MEARQLLSLMGRTKDTPCLKQEKTYERVFIPVFPSLSLHFFFFFLILAKEFTHQVLANSGNKELVKRDFGGYSKRAAGAPPPTPATLVSILVKRGQGCRKPVKKGVCRGCHPVDLSLDSVPPALPSQPRHYLINILRLWSCNNCFFPCGILRALAGSYPYSQHYGWTTAERKQKK